MGVQLYGIFWCLNTVPKASDNPNPISIPSMWEHGYPGTSTSTKNKKRSRKSNGCGDSEEHAAPAPTPTPPTRPPKHTKNRCQPQPPINPHLVAPPPLSQQVCNLGGHSPLRGDDSSNCGKPSIMPEKHMLQLVIDILQRRDTYEIFAEPVDPNEVEDYYQIIKEPMDFGTMRAKLHEGMYKNFDEFKHDVFLITRNAMHFNSSATIYFRQARAIHELAKRVFHVLGTDPENFEVEFSGTRRRSTRRAHNEANDFRLTTHVKASSVATNVSSKRTPSSVDTSIVGKVNGRNPLLVSMAFHTNRNNCGFFSGATVGRRSKNNIETDRRCTYRPQSYPFGCNKNLSGSNWFHYKPLVLTNNQGTNYRESLFLFVKDLGPTAHVIATQKIRELHESSPTCETGWGIHTPDQCQTPSACGTALRGTHHWDSVCITAPHRFSGLLPGCCCSVLKRTADIITDCDSAEGGEEDRGKKRKSCNGGASRSHGEESVVYTDTEGINVVSRSGREKIIQVCKSTEFCLGSCSSDASVGGVDAGGLNNSWKVSNKNSSGKCRMVTSADAAGEEGKLDENVLRPVILALEHSHGNASSESKSRNKKSCTASKDQWGTQSQSKASSDHVNGTLGRCHEGTGSLVTAMQETQPNLDCNKKDIIMEGPPAALSDHPFTFNMCFLKAQLNQMNRQGGRRHDDDDDELQLIKSRLETHKRASASFVDRQGQKRRRPYTTTCTTATSTAANMELVVGCEFGPWWTSGSISR